MSRIAVKFDEREQGHLATVTIENMAKANNLSSSLVAELETTFRNLALDEYLRVAVLTGEGTRSFIAGANLQELRNFDEKSGRAYITALQNAHQAIRELPVPVIARVNGACMGAGLETAASCDIRIASENAKGGGLACAVGAHQAEYSSLRHLEAHVTQNRRAGAP